jgi:GR25 family glycosyltransferase involved in LPS biosynthesis
MKIRTMFNHYLYKLFNPDLANLNNFQLLLHWNNKGNIEKRICSIETFFEKYPYFDIDYYKMYNNDIQISDKFKLMAHWHISGINQNRLCYKKDNIQNEPENKICTSNSINELQSFSLLEYEKNIYFNTKDFNDVLLFVLIENNKKNIDNIIKYLNLLNNEKWKLLLVLNGLDNYITESNKITIIKINEMNNISLVQYFLMKKYLKNNKWITFIENCFEIPPNYIDIFINILKYRDDLDIINFKNDDKIINYIINNNVDILNLHKEKYKILYTFLNNSEKYLINDPIYDISINNTLHINNDYSTFVVKLTNNIIDDIYIILIGLNISFKYNYNLYLFNNINNYQLFSNFNKISDISNINYFEYDINNLNNKKNYILNKIKYDTKYFEESFDKSIKLFNIQKKEKIIKFFNLLNREKETIGLYVSDEQFNSYYYDINLYFYKALSNLNFHDMNIILITNNEYIDFTKLYFLQNLNYYKISDILDEYNDEDKILISSLCNYIISDHSQFGLILSYFSTYSKKIFLPIYLKKNVNYNIVPKILSINIIFIDDVFDKTYLNNKLLITNSNQYILYNNHIYKYKLRNYNKIYITENILDSYIYDNTLYHLKYINNNYKTNYGIIKSNNKYYLSLYNNLLEYDINSIINEISYDINYIYIKEQNVDDNFNYRIGNIYFKINILFIIDNKTDFHIFEANVLILIRQNYINYNIIIFINNVNIDLNIEYYKSIHNNIYLYKSDIKLESLLIIYEINKLCDNNSLMMIMQNYLLDPTISLSFINLLFISKNLLSTDFYTLFIKKELINFIIYKYYINENFDHIIFLKNYIVKITNNYYFNKQNIKQIYIENIYIDNNYYLFSKNILNNYLALNYNNFSSERELLFDINFNNVVKKNLCINPSNDDYLDMFIHIYKNNLIDYDNIEKYLEIEINNNYAKNQIVFFISGNDDINNIYFFKDNEDCQLNIIHFSNVKLYDISDKINYIFLNISEISNNYKYNRALSYNIMDIVFCKNEFEYENIIYLKNINEFINFEYNEDKYITIKKDIFKKVGGFDPELFIYNDFECISFFINKISNGNNEESQYIKYYNKLNESNMNTLLIYIKERYSINYNLCNNIKTYIINLDERKDRYNQIYNECVKINLYNFERFSAIKPDINDIKKSNLMNPSKIWKKDVQYLKSACGCKMSHLEVLKKALHDKEEYILIVEDDIVFEENILIYLNLGLIYLKKVDWDIFFITTNLKKKDDAIKVNNNVLKIKNGLTTTAQLFKRTNINNIINVIENSDIEIDNTYNDYLDEKYCLYPMSAYQRESYSDINKVIMNYGKFNKKFTF